MIILGIDPGTQKMGYGLIDSKGGRVLFLKAGVVKVRGRSDSETLPDIKQELTRLIHAFKPEVFAIEKLFFVKNQKTGLAVAQARGVAILCATEMSLRIYEFSPNEVKVGLTGYGHADKVSVSKMVKLILNRPELKFADDAMDALAIAIFASQHLALKRN